MKSLITYAIFLLLSQVCFAQRLSKKGDALVQCIQKESKPNNNGDVTITKTCTYKNYRSVNIGAPDYKGRSFWSSGLYEKQNNRFVRIKNAEFFNQNRVALLAILNKKFQEAFKKDKSQATDADTKQCFDFMDNLRWYEWDDISISFDGDSVVFDISYGLGDACYSQDNGSVSFTFAYLKPYLK